MSCLTVVKVKDFHIFVCRFSIFNFSFTVDFLDVKMCLTEAKALPPKGGAGKDKDKGKADKKDKKADKKQTEKKPEKKPAPKPEPEGII